MTTAERHRIAVLVLPGAMALDVGIPAQIFQPRAYLPYDLLICGVRPGPVPAGHGMSFAVDHGLEALALADTVIVPGIAAELERFDEEALEALRQARRSGARVVSICTGAFVLAAAGLLDGLRATTHWQNAGDLARLHPQVRVDPRALYVDEGRVLTSAGVAAGIDLCLHLIRTDHGVALANTVARAIVAAPHRSGGQAQYVDRGVSDPGDRGLADTRAWALERLDQPLAVEDLARHARLSPRTFARRFVEETDRPPLQWLLRARVDRARELLETSGLGIDQIAARAGLGSAANLRLHFRRVLDTSPSEYRRAFADRAVER